MNLVTFFLASLFVFLPGFIATIRLLSNNSGRKLAAVTVPCEQAAVSYRVRYEQQVTTMNLQVAC